MRPPGPLALLRRATGMGLHVAGLSFHCGSQLVSNQKYLEALAFCRQLFSLAALEGIVLFAIVWWFTSRPRARLAPAGLFLAAYSVFRILV